MSAIDQQSNDKLADSLVRTTDDVSKHDPTWKPSSEILQLRRESKERGESKENEETVSTTTDYNLPEWFWDDETTDEERHIWMTQERCRRQCARQFQNGGMKNTREELSDMEREIRKLQAGTAAVNVEDYQ